MPGPSRFPLPLIAAFFALYVIWGSTYLVIRIGVEYWPPLMLGGIRFLAAAAVAGAAVVASEAAAVVLAAVVPQVAGNDNN